MQSRVVKNLLPRWVSKSHMKNISTFVCLFVLLLGWTVLAEETEEQTNKDTEVQEESTETEVEDEGEDVAMTLEEILATEADEGSYKKTRSCINSRQIRTYEVLNRQNLVLEMKGGDKFLITTRTPCQGMTRNAILKTEQRSSIGFCKGDTIQWSFEEFGGVSWGAPCWVSEFEPISDYQIGLLKEGLKSGRTK